MIVTTLVLSGVAVEPVAAQQTAAQQTIGDVLSFLLTNRSIPTGDFVQDERAAAATRDTISEFLALEVAMLPLASSASGFSYRLNPDLGTMMRSSESFGPSFTEWSLTGGADRASFGLSYSSVTFDNIDGQSLLDGTLVSTASVLRGEPAPFDVETIALRVHSDSVIASVNVGVTDRLDVSAALPFVRLSVEGERVDTYRGRRLVQATGFASASGAGDLVVRAKYGVMRRGASGLAVGGETRLPTGNEENLLGAGEMSLKARFMASLEGPRVGVHGDFGYWLTGILEGVDYAGAITVVAIPRVTFFGELFGRRLNAFGRLATTTEAHPRLDRVDTIRLTSVRETTDRVVVVGGVKWNVAGSWIVGANVLRSVTTSGLNASWTPTVALDYSFRK